MTEIANKPDHGAVLGQTASGEDVFASQAWQNFVDDIEQRLNDEVLGNQVVLSVYTVATLPPVPGSGWIFVSDETGGAVPAFSDGTDWRRCTDRAIVS